MPAPCLAATKYSMLMLDGGAEGGNVDIPVPAKECEVKKFSLVFSHVSSNIIMLSRSWIREQIPILILLLGITVVIHRGWGGTLFIIVTVSSCHSCSFCYVISFASDCLDGPDG